MERFDDIYSDAKWLEGKTAEKRASGKHTIKATPGPANVYEMLEGGPEPNVSTSDCMEEMDQDLRRLLTSADEYLQKSDEEDQEKEEEDTDDHDMNTSEDVSSDSRDSYYHMEFRQHKRDYYIQKMGYEKVDGSVLREQAECYVRYVIFCVHVL